MSLFDVPDYRNDAPTAPAGRKNFDWQVGAQSGVDAYGNPVFPISGNFAPTGEVNAQTGTSYTIDISDRGKLVTFSNSAAIAVTLPESSPSTIPSDFMCWAQNLGSGTATLSVGSPLVTVATLASGQGAAIFFDGANWEAVGGGGTTLALQVNGTPNADQSLLNLKAGSNVTLTDDGVGGVSIAASGGGSAAAWEKADAYPDIPPTSPSAYDDEFDATSLDAKWTLITATPAQYIDYNTSRPSCLYLDGVGSGSAGDYFFRQPFAPGTADFTALMKFRVLVAEARARVAMIFADSTALTNHMIIGYGGNFSSYPYFEVADQTSGYNNLASSGGGDSQTIWMYLQRWSSGSRWTVWYSGEGHLWYPLLDGYSRSLTVNYLDLIFSMPHSTGYWQASVDYFRINNNLNFPVNPSGSLGVTTRL